METVDSKQTSQAQEPHEASDPRRDQRRHRRRRRAEEVRARADGGARPRGRQGALARRQPDHLHRRAARAHHAADLRPDDGARPVPAGRAARHRLQDQGDRRPRQLGAHLRQGVRQPRSVQPDLLHRRQPGQVPDLAARRAEDPGQGHRREPRVRHRRRLRPLPLRHLRHRVPQGAARLRLRGLPRAAVPAAGRPQAGHRRRAGPQDEPEVLHRAAEVDPDRRRAEHGRLPHPPLRGGARLDERGARGVEEADPRRVRRPRRRSRCCGR